MNIDQYIAGFPPNVEEILNKIRMTIALTGGRVFPPIRNPFGNRLTFTSG